MKRTIQYIVLHCTATPATTTVESIVQYWKEQKGWKNPGYHYLIKRDGTIVPLFPEDKVANGVKNYNQHAIHISYIGGVDEHNQPLDNRTTEQKKAQIQKLLELKDKYPQAIIQGHRDFPNVTKACPSFDVREWLRETKPGLLK